MTDITVQDLQAIAVQCTEQFFNDNVPLSTSLCKQASERNLNSDQLQRAVEATNTLAYLKNVQVSGDRTSEFPLANYKDIVKMASLPAELLKQAAVPNTDPKPTEPDGDDDGFGFSRREQEIYFVKEAAINDNALEYAENQAPRLLEQLTKLASELKTDRYVDEALSRLDVDRPTFEKLAKLVHGDAENHFKDFANDVMVPYKSLEKAAKLEKTLGEATKVVAEIAHRKSLQKQAELTLPFLGRMLGNVGRAIVGSKAAGKLVNSNMSAGKFAPGKGVVGGLTSAATAPVRVPAKAIGKGVATGTTNFVKGTADRIGTKAQNVIAGTDFGQKLGVPTRTLKPETIANSKKFAATAGTVGAVAGAAFDVSAYHPGHTTTGDTKDIWSSLNG